MSHNSIGEDSAFPKMFDHAKYRYQDKNNHKILSQPNGNNNNYYIFSFHVLRFCCLIKIQGEYK